MTTHDISPSGRFTEAQLDLLKLFSQELPDETWRELKEVINRFFADRATAEIDLLFTEQGWDKSKIEEWGNEHMRTSYKA